MNRDFAEMLDALFDARADFLIVGAHALAAQVNSGVTGRHSGARLRASIGSLDDRDVYCDVYVG
jgi:hypothetical protein